MVASHVLTSYRLSLAEVPPVMKMSLKKIGQVTKNSQCSVFQDFSRFFFYFTEGLFHSSTESTTTGTTESNNGLDEKEDEKQIFHTLVHSSIHEKSPHNLHTRY